MFWQLIGSEAGSPDSFSVPFPGEEVRIFEPKQLFIFSTSHIAAPSYRVATAAIDRTIPCIAPAPVTFLAPSFIRASVASFVNSQGLIEIAPVNTPRFDHDPVTGARRRACFSRRRGRTCSRGLMGFQLGPRQI